MMNTYPLLTLLLIILLGGKIQGIVGSKNLKNEEIVSLSFIYDNELERGKREISSAGALQSILITGKHTKFHAKVTSTVGGSNVNSVIQKTSKITIHREEATEVNTLSDYMHKMKHTYVSGNLEGDTSSSLFSGIYDAENQVFEGLVRTKNASFYIRKLETDGDVVESAGYITEVTNAWKKKNSHRKDHLKSRKAITKPIVPDAVLKNSKSSQKSATLKKILHPATGYVGGVVLVADLNFYEEQCNGLVQYCIYWLLNTFQRSDAVLRSTDFDHDGYKDNIGIFIQNLVLHTAQNSSAYPGNLIDKDYGIFSNGGIRYLTDIASTPHEAASMVLYLTTWSLSDTITGKSFVGTACDWYDATLGYGYNVGFYSSSFYFWNFSPSRQDELHTRGLVREIAHLLGANEDFYGTSSACKQSFADGPTIMFEPYYVGYYDFLYYVDYNLHNFSNCSKNEIATKFLSLNSENLLNNDTCFFQPVAANLSSNGLSYCGDGVVDPGEECDCGDLYSCSQREPYGCCVPSDSVFETPCTFGSNYTCSSADRCCSPLCQPQEEAALCAYPDDCQDAAYCDGVSSVCESTYKPDGTPCADGRKACYQGKCMKTRCFSLGLEPCQIVLGNISCEVWCVDTDGLCKSIHDLGLPKLGAGFNETLFHVTGVLCNYNTGFCSQDFCITYPACNNFGCGQRVPGSTIISLVTTTPASTLFTVDNAECVGLRCSAKRISATFSFIICIFVVLVKYNPGYYKF